MKCYICKTPGRFESHHIIPLHLGGPKNGLQIQLCERCHSSLHLIANAFYKGKHDHTELFNQTEFERAKPLIGAIVDAKIKVETTGKPPDSIQRLMLEIPNELLVKLHIRKADCGYTSLVTFLMDLLKREAERQ
jgi:hypothetical protein